MKKLLWVCLLALLPVSSLMASGAALDLEKADVDVHNKQSLQRGAKYFVNYCMGCHSLKLLRYNRLGKDLGLTDQQVIDNLIFTVNAEGAPAKPGDLMTNAIPVKQAAEWFGAAPPDLSVTGRLRGGDWIYSFLKAFYADPSRPTGVNNTVFANVGMPHVLWELQGMQQRVEHKDEDGHVTHQLVLPEQGNVSPVEYDQIVRDLTTFLVYVSEPAQLHRKAIGVWVLLFLGIFFIVAYFLKKEYWKDVH
ncbi:MAG: cytochrome c1 [Proteobacteria bacterium]|nr:MAG: cytochrome c1 [Pseudomonadota bacterium]